jgi:lipoprotein-releasing system ATP-binding protein
MSAILQLTNVNKSYGINTPVETEVLHNINLTLEMGSFSALTGPSGSGKSTLLNLIGLLEAPTSGHIMINGQATDNLNDQKLTQLRGQSLGFIFQFHHLLPAFDALENVMMPAIVDASMSRQQAKKRATELLIAVGLAQALHKKPTELSGGMQQRVAIARALMMSPPLVLADEPTGNLDTHSADEVFQLMRKINHEQNIAFLIVTHDQRLAQRCDRRINLVDGYLQA